MMVRGYVPTRRRWSERSRRRRHSTADWQPWWPERKRDKSFGFCPLSFDILTLKITCKSPPLTLRTRARTPVCFYLLHGCQVLELRVADLLLQHQLLEVLRRIGLPL